MDPDIDGVIGGKDQYTSRRIGLLEVDLTKSSASGTNSRFDEKEFRNPSRQPVIGHSSFRKNCMHI